MSKANLQKSAELSTESGRVGGSANGAMQMIIYDNMTSIMIAQADRQKLKSKLYNKFITTLRSSDPAKIFPTYGFGGSSLHQFRGTRVRG